MEHLISSSLLLKEFIYAGGLIYLMEIICQSSQQQIRYATVDLISHCLINKQFGRRIQAIMNQYLPNVFVDTLKDQPETFLALFDGKLYPQCVYIYMCVCMFFFTLSSMHKYIAEVIKLHY